MKIATHSNILEKPLDAFNLGQAEATEGLDRGNFFMEHLETVRYENLFQRNREHSEESHSVSTKDHKTLVDV